MILLSINLLLLVMIGMSTSRKYNEIQLIRNYIGCFKDFEGKVDTGYHGNNVISCLELCSNKKKFTFAALKGNHCYCGEHFKKSSDESKCKMNCLGTDSSCDGQTDYSVFSVCEIGYHGDACDKPCIKCPAIICGRRGGKCLHDCHDNGDGCDISRLLTDVNIAYNRPVNQSSTHISGENTTYPPERAVDGNFNNTFGDKNKAYCSQTSKDKNVGDITWFHVDLGRPITIKGVVITNRAPTPDISGKRLSGVTISVLNDFPGDFNDMNTFKSSEKHCNTRDHVSDHEVTIEMNCNKLIEGRYLFAVLPRKEFLTICEIEVFAESCKINKNCKTNEECKSIAFSGTEHFRCFCQEGYSRQDLVSECKDVDECEEEPNICGNNSDCANNIGSYLCTCHRGFHDNTYGECVDIDECAATPNVCGDNANCTNNVGSYSCSCHDGYKEVSKKKCEDVDECLERSNTCRENENCTNTIGSFSCPCNHGFENGVEGGCLDVDECSIAGNYPCGNNTNCSNKEGSYECLCMVGYHGDPKKECVDTDECTHWSNSCVENSNCTNNIGSYECHCTVGFYGDPYQKCHDLDECSPENYGCGENMNCKNKVGSFECFCKDGFRSDSNQGCVAISNPAVAVVVPLIVLLLLASGAFLVYFYISRIRKMGKANDSEKIVLSENANNATEEKENTKIKVENLASYMLNVMTKCSSGFADQFEKIPKIANYSMAISKASGKGKNRFTNIVPYDYNRVVLKISDKESDYINASHIETGKQKFIAAQGPTNETVNHFWQMIVEQDVSNIVMLTQIVEKNKNKCFQYWPDDYETKFGSYTVTLESSIDFEDYIRRKLKVVSTDNTKESKTVMQWHYMCWPDHGVPTNVDSFLKFNKVSMQDAVKNKAVLVHCSAGVGRTGCFIAIDLLLDEAKREGSVDVVACVSRLREQRSNMVQSAIQYDFIYYALKCTLTQPSTDIPLDLFHSNLMVLSEGNDLKDEFQRLKDEADYLDKRGKVKFKSSHWSIYSFMGVAVNNHHHIGYYPEEKATPDFWNFCFQSKCVVVLIDKWKTLEQNKFLPISGSDIVTDKFCITLKEQQSLQFGTLLDVSMKTLFEENAYENKAQTGNEFTLKVLKIRSNDETHISGELFRRAMQIIDSLNRNRRFKNLFVLSPEKSALASYFVACCDLNGQLSSRNHVDIYRTVLELKRAPISETITLDHYKKLYIFTENQLQLSTNVCINR